MGLVTGTCPSFTDAHTRIQHISVLCDVENTHRTHTHTQRQDHTTDCVQRSQPAHGGIHHKPSISCKNMLAGCFLQSRTSTPLYLTKSAHIESNKATPRGSDTLEVPAGLYLQLAVDKALLPGDQYFVGSGCSSGCSSGYSLCLARQHTTSSLKEPAPGLQGPREIAEGVQILRSNRPEFRSAVPFTGCKYGDKSASEPQFSRLSNGHSNAPPTVTS